MTVLFADTSALFKWYISEVHSDDVDALFSGQSWVTISQLAGMELRSALGRRRRGKLIPLRVEKSVLELFQTHQRLGNLRVLPIDNSLCAEAERLMQAYPKIPLRTLDAMQLAAAIIAGTPEFATADRIQASAARAAGLLVHDFS